MMFYMKGKKMLYNEIKLDLGERKENHGKGRKFSCKFFEPGVAGYPEMGKNYLIKKENADKFIDSIVGCNVVIKHKEVTDDNVKDVSAGIISSVRFNEKDGWYHCEGVLTSKEAEELIEKGWSVSCAYNVLDKDIGGGTWNGVPYDVEVLDGDFEHLAIVENPRYKEATVLLNSEEEKEEEMLSLFNAKKILNSEKGKENMAEENKEKSGLELISELLKGKVEDEVKDKILNECKKMASKLENEEEAKMEPEKEKSEEEPKKEPKKEPKEKVENSFEEVEKLKNSIEKVKEPSAYVPESERLEAGKNY